jgi:hypothetical protein
VAVFDRDGGGLDVDWSDARRAPKGTPRLVIDGDVGAGFLEVRHHNAHAYWRGRRVAQPDGGVYYDTTERNSACSTRTASSGASNG